MKRKIPPGIVVAVLILALLAVCWYGWRTVHSGPNSDVTAETIKYYKGMRAQMNAQHATNMGEAAKKGGPTYSTQASPGPGGASGMPGAPSYGMPPGAAPTGSSAPGR